jgi:hypothetical protein
VGEELLRTVARLQKDGFYSVRHFILLKRTQIAGPNLEVPPAADTLFSSKPKKTIWAWLTGSWK